MAFLSCPEAIRRGETPAAALEDEGVWVRLVDPLDLAPGQQAAQGDGYRLQLGQCDAQSPTFDYDHDYEKRVSRASRKPPRGLLDQHQFNS